MILRMQALVILFAVGLVTVLAFPKSNAPRSASPAQATTMNTFSPVELTWSESSTSTFGVAVDIKALAETERVRALVPLGWSPRENIKAYRPNYQKETVGDLLKHTDEVGAVVFDPQTLGC